jgi:hypothetical protein
MDGRLGVVVRVRGSFDGGMIACSLLYLLLDWISRTDVSLALATRGTLSGGANQFKKGLRIVYLGDVLYPDSPDNALVEAFETVAVVNEILPLQIDELTLDVAIAHIYNFGPHVLAYSASTCDDRIDHKHASEIFKHCSLMGTRTMSFVLRCADRTSFRFDPYAGFWRADIVLVDDWGPAATARWLEAGVRIAWLGHAIPARACADDSFAIPARGADPTDSSQLNAEGSAERDSIEHDDVDNVHIVIFTDGGDEPRQCATADFLRHAYGDRLLLIDRAQRGTPAARRALGVGAAGALVSRRAPRKPPAPSPSPPHQP